MAKPYYAIQTLKQKIMADFNHGTVDVDKVSDFIQEAVKSGCFAIAEDMQKRLDDHIDKKEAGIRSYSK